MLTAERKKELAGKIKFVKDIEAAVLNNIKNVAAVNYEIYEHNDEKEASWVEERLVVVFKGDAISVRNCNSTSCAGILKAIATLVQGGYYSEIPYYEELSKHSDYHRIDKDLLEEYYG